MSIRFEKGISKGNASLLCEWSNKKGKNFQEQWMGPEAPFPLTSLKIQELKDVFSIFRDKEFIGIIQKVKNENDNIHIGRFIINPRKTGFGYGTEALKNFIGLVFKDNSVKSISLTVFGFNKNAKKLYEKLGFEIENTIETPKLKYILKKYNH